MSFPILGIDIAKAKFDCYLSPNQKHKVFKNNSQGYAELSIWLVTQGVAKVHACMEATGNYGDALATSLHETGHIVSIVNPARIKGFAQSAMSRTKTDKADAKLIAQFCQALQPKPWTPPAPEVKELQALVRHLEALNEMLGQEKNRLAVASTPVSAIISKHIAYLEKTILEIKQKIQEHIRKHPNLAKQSDLLQSVPGIGETTAANILAEIGSVQNFGKARQLAAFAGVVPSQHSSGSSVHGKSRMCKKGNAFFRKALFFPAIVAKQHNPIIAVFCKRLAQSGKTKMAIIVAAMRKLAHIIFGILKSGKPFDRAYAV